METMKSFGILIVKILFFIICILVSLVCAIVSAYFSIRFYQYGTYENQTLYLLLAMLAICIEVIKYSMSLFYPILIGRDLVHEKLINSMLRLSLIMSILASLTFFLVSHSNFQPVNRIVDLLYNTFLTKMHLDYGRGIVAFVGNCIFSIIIEYFILLLPKVSTLPFRPKIENYKDIQYERSTFGKIAEMIAVIPVYFVDKMYNKVMQKYKVVQLESSKIREIKNKGSKESITELEANDSDNKVLLDESKKEELRLLSNKDNGKSNSEESLEEGEKKEFFDYIDESDKSNENEVMSVDNIMDFSKKKKVNVNFNLHDNKGQDENTFISKYIEKYKNKNDLKVGNENLNEIDEKEIEEIEELTEHEQDVYEIGNFKRSEGNSSVNYTSMDELEKVRLEKTKQNNLYSVNNYIKSNEFDNIEGINEEKKFENSIQEDISEQDSMGIKKRLGEKLPFNIENVKRYFDYLQENSKDDVAVGYKKVAENTGLKQGEALRIFNQLRDKGYLRTENKTTKIKKRKLNAFDFISD